MSALGLKHLVGHQPELPYRVGCYRQHFESSNFSRRSEAPNACQKAPSKYTPSWYLAGELLCVRVCVHGP